MTGLGSPERVTAQARDLETAAWMVDRTRHVVLDRTRAVGWQGRRATQVRTNVEGIGAELSGIVEALNSTVATLRRHAEWLEQQRALLANLERRIRAWIRAHPPGSGAASNQPDASIVRVLPGPFSPEWQTLATLIRRRGGVF